MRRMTLLAAVLLSFAACAGENADEENAGTESPAREVENQTSEEIFALPDESPGGEAPEGELDQPVWFAPPPNEVGVPVGFDPVVFEGDNVAVALTGITVYSTGLQLHATAFTHPAQAGDEVGPASNPMGRGSPGSAGGNGLPDDLLRLAVSYPNGETASTVGEPGRGSTDEPDGPVLSQGVSQGDQTAWHYQLWLWPRPEAGEGRLEFIAEWPEMGIDLTRADLPLDEIDSAADSVVELWPEPVG